MPAFFLLARVAGYHVHTVSPAHHSVDERRMRLGAAATAGHGERNVPRVIAYPACAWAIVAAPVLPRQYAINQFSSYPVRMPLRFLETADCRTTRCL
jgi:hypothetical protein